MLNRFIIVLLLATVSGAVLVTAWHQEPPPIVIRKQPTLDRVCEWEWPQQLWYCRGVTSYSRLWLLRGMRH